MIIHSPGELIADRYEIASRPLRGRTSVVYFCLDHLADRPVALKAFRPDFLPDAAARQQLVKIGENWKGFDQHPHIVQCYDVVEIPDADEIGFVLELISTTDGFDTPCLREWIAPKRPLSLEQALLFTLQIARGMRYASQISSGYAHGALDLTNILVGADQLINAPIQRVRVTNFGLMTIGAEDNYLAPQQRQGAPISPANDIYALGCLLYDMLAGEPPIQGNISPLLAHLPDELHSLVGKCLELDPRQRYSNWAEVEGEIVRVYEHTSQSTAPVVLEARLLDQAERIATGWAYCSLGISCIELSDARTALDYFRRSRDIGQDAQDPRLEAAALCSLGVAQRRMGGSRQAMQSFEQALEIQRGNADLRGENITLTNIGNTSLEIGEAKRALESYEQALEVARKMGEPRLEESSLANLGTLAHQSGDLSQAIRFYLQALEISRILDDYQGQGLLLSNLGSSYLYLGDPQTAINHYSQALEIARQLDDPHLEGSTASNLGAAYIQIGKPQIAIEYYKQHLAICLQANDLSGQSKALGSLGVAHYHLNDLHRASDYLSQSLEIKQEINDVHGEEIILSNLGAIHAELQDLPRALQFYSRALDISCRIQDIASQGTILGNLGQIYHSQGKLEQALECYNRAMEIAQQTNDFMSMGRCSLNLASLLYQAGDPSLALRLARQAAKIFSQSGAASLAQQAQALIAHIQGNHDST